VDAENYQSDFVKVASFQINKIQRVSVSILTEI